jgi:hypothetical protein
MSAMQKWAWFNLAVIALTLVAILSLLPFMGKGALGGFGFLGLMGLGPFFFIRKKHGQVLADERDILIQRRSWVLAYSLFWVVFVLAAVLSAVAYGQDGAIPVWVVQYSVFCGFMLVHALHSIATLVQYAGGSRDAE